MFNNNSLRKVLNVTLATHHTSVSTFGLFSSRWNCLSRRCYATVVTKTTTANTNTTITNNHSQQQIDIQQTPILNSSTKIQISKSGKIYTETNLTPGLQKFLEKSRIINRELAKSGTPENKDTKLDNDTDAHLQTLLLRSVTHASYGTGKVRSQERLSFIGSFVLNMVLTEIISQKYMVNQNNCGRENFNTVNLIKSIYNNRSFLAFIVANQYWNLSNQYNNKTVENDTKLNKSLNQIGTKYNITDLNDNIIEVDNEHYTLRVVGWNEMSFKSQVEILSNTVNAIIGTIYSKCGLQVAREFIEEEIIKERPAVVYKKLLLLDEPQMVLNDLASSQYYASIKFIEEYVKANNCHKCTIYVKQNVIGDANAKDNFKAKKLACFDGLMRFQSMIPSY